MDPGRDPPPGYIRGSRGLQVPKPRPTKSSEVLPSHSHGVGPGGWEDQTTEMRCAPAAHTRRNHLAKASSDGGRRSGTYVKTQRPVDKLTRKGVSRSFGEVTARLRPAPDPLVRRSGNSHSPGHPGPRSMKLGKCSSDYNHSEKTTLNSGGPSSRTRELFLGGWDGASGTPGLQTRGGAVSSGGLLGAGCLPRKRTGGLFFPPYPRGKLHGLVF